MEAYCTPQTIIKALKGPNDPPKNGGPSKIEIAKFAWDSTAIRFPNKDEVLAEWIINSFLKEKANPDITSTLFSELYWSLLNQVLSSNPQASRSSRVWLPPFLVRYSISPMISTFISAVKRLHQEMKGSLLEQFAQCMQVIWPLVTARLNLDALTDCFNAVMSYVSLTPDFTDSKLDSVCLMIIRSFRYSFGNSSTKKKVFTSFVQQNFSAWIRFITSEPAFEDKTQRDKRKILKSELTQVGIDILFSIDALKGPQDPLDLVFSQGYFSPCGTPCSQLKAVPLLYKAYVEEIQKSSATIFGSGSSQAQEQTNQNKYKEAGLKAFSVCYRTLREFEDNERKWGCIHEVLEIMEAAHLTGNNISERIDMFDDVISSALTQLKAENNTVQELAVKVLHMLTRIDFDFVCPRLSDTLSNLLTMDPTIYPSCNELLHEILEFHVKARTLPSYISHLVMCLIEFPSSLRTSKEYPDIRLATQSCLAGSLLGFSHIENLSRITRSFLTPGQTPEVVQDVVAAFKSCKDLLWENVDAMDVDEPNGWNVDVSKRRHRRSSMENMSSLTKADCAALSYSLLSRLMAIILPSLPYSTLSEASKDLILSSISSMSSELDEVLKQAFPTCLSKRPMQCVSIATLRLQHTFRMSPYLSPLNVPTPNCILENIPTLLKETETIPELIVEIFRSFFDNDVLFEDRSLSEGIISHLISYITSNLEVEDKSDRKSVPEFSWDGLSSSLNTLETGSHARGALAVLYLTLDRWLSIIEEIASQAQLKAIARLCFLQLPVDKKASDGGVSIQWILSRTMQSASFWELPRLRDALINEAESSFPQNELKSYSEYISQSFSGIPKRGRMIQASWNMQKIIYAQFVFSTLLRSPREYLSRASRVLIIQRALVTDFECFLFARETGAEYSRSSQCRYTQALARAWLVANAEYVGLWEIAPEPDNYIGYLIQSSACSSKDNNDLYVQVTTELLIVIFKQVIQLSLHGETEQFTKVCGSLQKLAATGEENYLLLFIDFLLTECPSSSKLPASALGTIRELLAFLRAQYASVMTSPTAALNLNKAQESEDIIHSWRVYLALSHWLGINGHESLCGVKILQYVIAAKSTTGELRALGTQVFCLLLEELYIAESLLMHLSIIVSSYVLLDRLQLSKTIVCDSALVRTIKNISVSEYSYVLSFIREAIEKSASGEKRLLVHLSRVLLEAAPEGAMRVIQEHSEETVRIFLGNEVFSSGDISLCSEVLTFIETVVITRPAFLRLNIVGSIWVILSNFLTGRAEHTSESHPVILRSICSIIGSIIRLRRDLVVSNLPHLVVILRLLIHTLCAPRPQLGSRQLALVANTLPMWISPSAPLGVQESKEVARLLTALQAKTIPRTFNEKTKAKERTAESLLTPFSKHAASVVSAYLTDLANPLLLTPTNVREALVPGLYVLCESMGEHGRNALMAWTSDASGRAALKSLWRSYEKQRYVGKG